MLDLLGMGFPSPAHYTALTERAEANGYNWAKAFPDERDRTHWHAYDYGWRRVWLSDTADISPIDAGRRWFHAVAVDEATTMFRRATAVSRNPRITPADEADRKGDFDRAARHRAQDRERAAALAAIEGNGKLFNGQWSEESHAFAALCRDQARANAREFMLRGQMGVLVAQDVLRTVQRELGLSATMVGEPSAVDDSAAEWLEPPAMSRDDKERLRGAERRKSDVDDTSC